MIEVTGDVQYEAWQSRAVPPVEQVRSSVWSIPIDCGDFPVRYTFAYAIVGDGGRFMLIDPGFKSAIGDAQLSEGLRIAGLRLEGLVGIVVTHFHVDHLAGAPALAARADTWFGMHAAERMAFPGWPDPRAGVEQHERVLDAWGVPDGADRPGRLGEREYLATAPTALPDRHFEDGELLELAGRNLQVVWTPGHTAGHIAVLDHDEGLAFTGDQVLPNIRSNVSAYLHDQQHDAIGDHLSALDRISEWDGYEACPAHEYRFRGIRTRADELRAHQQRRSAEISAVVEQGSQSAWDVAQRLRWGRGWASLAGPHLRAALGETQAHLNHLNAVAATRAAQM